MSANITSPSLAFPFLDVDLGPTLGALFIGNVLGIMLWGLEAFQVVWYYINYPEDPGYLKLFVLILFGVGTSHEVSLFVGVYRYLIRHYGNIDLIAHQELHMLTGVLLTSIAAGLAQLFYVFRIHSFAQRKIVKYGVPLVLLPFIIWEFGGGSYYVVKGLGFPLMSQLASLEVLGISFTAAACAADVLIAVTMCSLLYSRRTGVRRTDQVISYLILASINTGFWTAVIAIAIMIIIPLTPPTHLIYIAPYLALPSVYINSVMCNLNIRQPLRSLKTEISGISLPTTAAARPKRHGRKDTEASICWSMLTDDREAHSRAPSQTNSIFELSRKEGPSIC